MKKIVKGIFVASILIAITMTISWSPGYSMENETINITVPVCYLMDGPGNNYKVLSKATRDEPLTLISYQGNWFQVMKTNGVIGWVHRDVLAEDISRKYPGPADESRYEPTDKPSGDAFGDFLDTIEDGFMGESDNDLTGSVGVRGVDEEWTDDPGYYSDNYSAVDFMESIYISTPELTEFIKEGRLNP